MSILVVEDIPSIQIATKAMLTALGYESTVASGGEEALQVLLIDDSFDLILMDCNMPGWDGFETTRQIKKRVKDNLLKEIPIIAYTANNGEYWRNACRESGMDDFIHKPAAVDDLQAVLSTWLQQ